MNWVYDPRMQNVCICHINNHFLCLPAHQYYTKWRLAGKGSSRDPKLAEHTAAAAAAAAANSTPERDIEMLHIIRFLLLQLSVEC